MNTIKRILFAVVVLSIAPSIHAQLKIGHINSQELMMAMPEMDSANAKLQALYAEYQEEAERLNVELNKKYNEYVERSNNKEKPISDLVKSSLEAEITQMQDKVQQYQQIAEQDLTQQQENLIQPVQQKAIQAINEVAAENGFTYIMDTFSGAIIYTAPESEDILPLVKAKLGLQ